MILDIERIVGPTGSLLGLSSLGKSADSAGDYPPQSRQETHRGQVESSEGVGSDESDRPSAIPPEAASPRRLVGIKTAPPFIQGEASNPGVMEA
jgi:hypothetical protein